jgi:hypothetical protein
MATKQKPKAPTSLIENIAEASKNARKIYFLYIGFLAYFGLTVVSTSDRQIILNEKASLPFLGLEVSLDGFFIIAPLMAILVFVYLQLYLYRLKTSIDDLRNNYAPVEKWRLYPWMINIAKDPDSGLVGQLQGIVVKFSLWILLPLILTLISIWFVKKHDPFLSYIVGISPMLGAFVALFFWCQYEDIRMREFFRRNLGGIFIYIVFLLISVLLLMLGALFSSQLPILAGMSESAFWSLMGVGFVVLCSLLRYLYLKLRRVTWKHEGKTILVSSVFTFGVLLIFIIIPQSNKGSLISVDLSHQKLVTEPETDYEGLFWGNLEGANLNSAILKRVDFRHAFLQKAWMPSAILEGANLQAANLERATLERADLREADLRRADLREADLREAELEGANLIDAKLQGANLRGARNLTFEQLSRVKTLYEAELDSNLMEQLKRDHPRLLEEPPKPK